MEDKLSVRKLSKSYGDFFKLGENSFSIPKGYITGFIGKNGSGKTTTIKALLSMISYEGEILYEGKDTSNLAYLQDVGIVMDDSFLSRDWSLDLVNEAMEIGYKNWDEEKYYHYLEEFDLDRKKKVKELSRGMKIKLMLAVAFSHDASLLILDEPTSGLDPSMRYELSRALREYVENPKNTVLFSTHITEDLERLADFIIFIDQGKVLASKSLDDFLKDYYLIKGSREDINLLDKSSILGVDLGKYSFEALILAKDFETDDLRFEVERPYIDKIMVLYGRK